MLRRAAVSAAGFAVAGVWAVAVAPARTEVVLGGAVLATVLGAVGSAWVRLVLVWWAAAVLGAGACWAWRGAEIGTGHAVAVVVVQAVLLVVAVEVAAMGSIRGAVEAVAIGGGGAVVVGIATLARLSGSGWAALAAVAAAIATVLPLRELRRRGMAPPEP